MVAVYLRCINECDLRKCFLKNPDFSLCSAIIFIYVCTLLYWQLIVYIFYYVL